MRKLKQKIRSRRGASISFALMIFLVCAIISGVVIVAASTAGGRLSGMKETDQRYYAATEAAHVLQDIFDSKTVEVTYNVSNPADPNNPPTTAATGILADLSKAVISNSTISTIGPISTEEGSSYTCTITPRLENGLAYFDIEAAGGTENISKGTYKLTIVFSSNVKKPETSSNSGSAKATVSWKLNSLSRAQAEKK